MNFILVLIFTAFLDGQPVAVQVYESNRAMTYDTCMLHREKAITKHNASGTRQLHLTAVCQRAEVI
jgi:hypothetical protein